MAENFLARCMKAILSRRKRYNQLSLHSSATSWYPPDIRIAARVAYRRGQFGHGRHKPFLKSNFSKFGTKSRFPRDCFMCAWGNAVLSRDYLTRQASMLLKFAKA